MSGFRGGHAARPAAPDLAPGRGGHRGARRPAGRAAAGDEQRGAGPTTCRLASTAIVAARSSLGTSSCLSQPTCRSSAPAPQSFLRLRDLALARSPIASATLTGTEITSPAWLKSRSPTSRRVWVVTGASSYKFPHAAHAGRQGEDGAAGRDAHPRSLAGGRGDAHAVRVLTASRPRAARPGRLRRRTTPPAGAEPAGHQLLRIFLRPRCSRDITVPTGVPMISAISR